MKGLFLIGIIAAVSCSFVIADQELANRLKPYEQFSPYQWTKWIELRPPASGSGVAAAVAYSEPARPAYRPSEDEDDMDDESEESADDAVPSWFRRAILPQPPPESPVLKASKKKSKSKTKTESTSSEPSIVPVGFWGPPPTTTPNETVILPPGYWAAKKSMFVAKLFEALALSVLNSTGPPTEAVTTTTTVSPQDAILNELQTVLLSDVARSLPSDSQESAEVTTASPSQEEEESDEASEESEEQVQPKPQAAVTLPPLEQLKSFLLLSQTKVTTPTPTVPTTTPTPTVDPIMLGKLEFLSKLSEAIANQQSKAAAAAAAPPTTTTEASSKSKPGKKGAKSKSKKTGKKSKGPTEPTTPKWMKYIPTTTTTPPPPTINYDALAQALIGG